jgi:hypothetical protein
MMMMMRETRHGTTARGASNQHFGFAWTEDLVHQPYSLFSTRMIADQGKDVNSPKGHNANEPVDEMSIAGSPPLDFCPIICYY